MNRNGSDIRNFIRRPATVRLFALLLASLLLLLGFVFPSFGWTLTNRIADQNTVEMQIDDDSISAIPFTAYIYDNVEQEYRIPEGEDVTLPRYDSVFVEENEYSCLIYKAPIFGSAISAGSAFTVTLDLQDRSDETGLEDNNFRDSNKVDAEHDDLDAIANFVSNTAYIKCAVIPELQGDAAEGDEKSIYDVAHAYFLNSNSANYEAHQFLTFEPAAEDGAPDVGTKEPTVTFTLSDYEAPEENGILYVYFEVSYQPDLVRRMLDSFGFEFSGDVENNSVEMDSDMNQFYFDLAN